MFPLEFRKEGRLHVKPHSRVIHHYFSAPTPTQKFPQRTTIKSPNLSNNIIIIKDESTRPHKNRHIHITKKDKERQDEIRNSKTYKHGMADELEEGSCVRQYDWQLESFPTCNTIHELSFEMMVTHDFFSYLSFGNYRNVWLAKAVTKEDIPYVVKTQK